MRTKIKIRNYFKCRITTAVWSIFLHEKMDKKRARVAPLTCRDRFRFYESLLPVHSTADVIVLVQSDFHCVKIKLLFANQSLRRRFSFSFIVRNYPTTQKVLQLHRLFYATHSLWEKGYVAAFWLRCSFLA